jgi:hypothetical protein
MLRKTIAYFLILMLMCYALAISALEQLALTNPTSNDNYAASTSFCQTLFGGPCSEDRPIHVTQDETVTNDWLLSEPYACTYILNTNGAEYWLA